LREAGIIASTLEVAVLKTGALLLLFMLLSVSGALCQEQGFPRTVADDLGGTLTLREKPQRIVSVTLPTDEILLSLVGRGRLVAVTPFSHDPGVSNIASEASGIPQATLNVELIVSLKPDMVFVADWSDAGSVSQLRGAGVPVYLFKSPTTVREVEESITRIGTAVGEETKASLLVQGMEGRLAAVERLTGKIPHAKRFTVIDYGASGISMGKGSSWDEIVLRAGLRNPVDDLASDRWGQVPVSKEELLKLDPDMLVIPDWVYGNPKGSDSLYAAVVADPALRGLKAVRNGRVYRMPARLMSSTDQYIVAAVEELSRLAYPGLFRPESP
jgi:iron complex transport system substrate-binding protein